MEEKDSKKKKVIAASIAAAVIVLGIGGFYLMNRRNSTTVPTYPVAALNEYGYFGSESSMSGTVVDEFSQNVTLREDYKLKRIHVRKGQKVKKGDILVTYDCRREELEMKLKEIEVLKRERDVEARENALTTLRNTGKDTYNDNNNLPGNDMDEDDARVPERENRGLLAAMTDLIRAVGDTKGAVVCAEDPPEATTKATQDTKPAEAATEKGKEEEKPSDESSDGNKEEEKPSDESSDGNKEELPSVTLTSLVEALTGDKVDTSCMLAVQEGKKQRLEIYIKQDGDSDVTGKAILDAIDVVVDGSQYSKVVFKRYKSQEDYDKGGSPNQELEIKRGFYLEDSITSDGKFSLEDIKNHSGVATKDNMTITPSSNSVRKGNSYNYSLQVDGTSLSSDSVSVVWSLKGNKSKNTTINPKTGKLKVASGEKAEKLKIIANVNGVKVGKKVKVKAADSKSKTEKGSSSTSTSNSGSDQNGGTNIDSEDNYIYKGEELQEQISNREDELTDAKIELEEARIKYQELKRKVDAATVRASMNGMITVAYTRNNLPESGKPIVVVKSRGGTYVQFDVNEMKLGIVKEGGTLRCQKDYDNYAFDEAEGNGTKLYEAQVTDIADYPTSTGAQQTDYWTDTEVTNPNSSYYIVTGSIKDADGLSSGDVMRVIFDSKSMGTQEEAPVIVMAPFIRQEGRRYYVYKVGEGNRLKKQYVQIGKTSYGYTQILSGLDEGDYIAFPYNKDELDDARTKKEDDASQIIETLYEAPEFMY